MPQDTDTGSDYYDARICTIAEPCVAAPAPTPVCQGEACRGSSASAPVFGALGSAVFSGAGNLAPLEAVKPAVKPKKKAKPKRTKKRKRGKQRRKAGRSGKHVKRGRK